MKKAKLALTSLLVLGTAAAISARSTASQDPHAAHRHQQQAAAQMPPLLADGAVNPNAVPDLIAYEILFNSIADNGGISELERIRANSLAAKTGLDQEKIALLKSAAGIFKQRIRDLDDQAKAIKDREWPKPSLAARTDLAGLQKQKEAILTAEFAALLSRLSDDDRQKLDARLLQIKRQVKVYQDLPLEAYQKH